MSSNFKYFAFISYSSQDLRWGKRLQRKLENYRLPATLCSEHNLPRNPMKPVFFAPTDIQPGGLTEEIQERLKSSRNLIVICSPHSAQSEWVGKEIEFFHNLGRTKNIHFFIVEGAPHSGNAQTECFNPIIKKLGLPEFLGANIHEKIYGLPLLNRERAYVQLVSKLLGVEFDTIWQRHKKRLINKAIAWTIGLTIVVCAMLGVWQMNRSFDMEIRLEEVTAHNDNLPPLQKAVVTLVLDNETKRDTLYGMDSVVRFTNIPHRYLNQTAGIVVTCCDIHQPYLPVDTTFKIRKQNMIPIRRDTAVYGNVKFFVYGNEGFVKGVKVEIEGYEAVSDETGCVSLYIPLEKQKTQYRIKSSLQVEDDIIKMPAGERDVMLVK